MEAFPFELVVVCSGAPGDMGPRERDWLAAKLPSAALVVLQGPWSEADGRSGFPIPGLATVSMTAWPWELAAFVKACSEGQIAAWQFPSTYTLEDRVLALATQTFAPHRKSEGKKAQAPSAQNPQEAYGQHTHRLPLPSLSIWSQRLDSGLALEEAARALGYLPRRHETLKNFVEDSSPSARILDVDLPPQEKCIPHTDGWKILRLLPQNILQHTVLLTGFARPEEQHCLSELGFAAVLGKPFLFAAIEAALQNIDGRLGSKPQEITAKESA